MARSGALERRRYVPGHWGHAPSWRLFDDGGDGWFGFSGVRALRDSDPDVLLVPLRGHSAGHTGVAVRDGARWLLHAGDAYYFHGQIDTPPRSPVVLRVFQGRADTDRALRIANQERLRALRAGHRGVTVFCAHDAVELDRARAAAEERVTAGSSRAAESTGT
jgi:glyoxylase-like metal-dependent hydrolase (beta-lactamase superfamily II)